jgi:WD40 repeat protein
MTILIIFTLILIILVVKDKIDRKKSGVVYVSTRESAPGGFLFGCITWFFVIGLLASAGITSGWLFVIAIIDGICVGYFARRIGAMKISTVRRVDASSSVSQSREPLLVEKKHNGSHDIHDAILGIPSKIRVERRLQGHPDVVLCVSFSPNGVLLASAGRDAIRQSNETVKLWYLRSEQGDMKVSTLAGHPVASCVCFTPDSKLLLSGGSDNCIRIWSLRQLRNTGKLSGHNDLITSMLVNASGDTLISASMDGTIRLWDLGEKKEITTLEGHYGGVSSLARSPDEAMLLSGSLYGGIKFWDLNGRKELNWMGVGCGGIRCVACHRNGKIFACGGGSGEIVLCDLNTREEISRLKGHSDSVNAVAFSPKGDFLVSGGSDNKIKLWDFNKGREIMQLDWHRDRVCSLSFSPNGELLASGSWDNTIVLGEVVW